MIIDRIENIDNYFTLSRRIKTALEYLASTDFSVVPKGRYPVDGDNIYAMVNEYQTKPEAECKIEAHRKYIDVQFLVTGEEIIGYAPLVNQQSTTTYNDEQDYIFYHTATAKVRLTVGMFAVFFPRDLHQPGISTQTDTSVKKVVVKIRI